MILCLLVLILKIYTQYLKIRLLNNNTIVAAAISKFDEQEVTILTKDMTLCDKHRHQRHCDWETPRDNIRPVCSICCNKASNCCNSCRSPTPTRHQPSPERNSNISSSFRIQSLFKKNRLYIMEEGEFQMDSGEFYVSAEVRAAFDKLG